MANDSSQQSWNELLLAAVEAEDLELMAEAMACGANAAEPCGEHGFVSTAAMTGNVEVLRRILAAGGNPNERASEPGSAFAGSTSLYWGVFGGRLELVEMLIDAGARVENECPVEESTSVHSAATHGRIDLLEVLMKRAGGRAALNTFDYISRTPLLCAVERNDLAAARLLIAAGSNVDAHDEQRMGNTALREAVGSGTLEMVELLLRAGADPRIEGWTGRSAYQVAASRQGPSGERVRKLLQAWRDR